MAIIVNPAAPCAKGDDKMRCIDKCYKRPDPICCSQSIEPVLKDEWEYCPKCGKPAKRNWMTQDKVLSGWLRVFAWWPSRVAGFWLWLEHYERVVSLTGINSSAGGFEFASVEYTRLIDATSVLTVESKGDKK